MNASILDNRSGRSMWLTVLGAFTLWLVVQNTVLMTIVSVLHPEFAVGLVVDALRMVVHAVTASSKLIASLAVSEHGTLFGVVSTLTGGLL